MIHMRKTIHAYITDIDILSKIYERSKIAFPHICCIVIAVCRLRMIEAVTINKSEGKSQGCALLGYPLIVDLIQEIKNY